MQVCSFTEAGTEGFAAGLEEAGAEVFAFGDAEEAGGTAEETVLTNAETAEPETALPGSLGKEAVWEEKGGVTAL